MLMKMAIININLVLMFIREGIVGGTGALSAFGITL